MLGMLLFLLARSLGVISTGATTKVEVPNVVGLPVDEASQTADARPASRSSESTRPTTRPSGIVFDQDPDAGSRADKGSAVTLHVSTGRCIGDVPDVVGQDVERRAGRTRRRPGFTVNVVSQTGRRAAGEPRPQPGPGRRHQGAGRLDGDDHGVVGQSQGRGAQRRRQDENDAIATLRRAGLVGPADH